MLNAQEFDEIIKTYPIDYNPVIEYFNRIESGEEVVGNKVYKVYRELVRIINDKDSKYKYDPKRGNHPIEFIESFCKHSKGKWAGQPIELELWQKAAIAAAYGFIDKIDGTRKHKEVLLVVARKNGKSTLSSGESLYKMIADGEGGPEIYAVASKRDQAKIVWNEAKRMVKKSPMLSKVIKTRVSEMSSDFNDGTFTPLGRDSETLDGLNVHGASMDEIHAWKFLDLYDVIYDGTSSRDNSMIFAITTAGSVREAVYDIKYEEAENIINGYEDEEGYENESFLPIIYELDERKEWTDESTWKKANPGLGTIKNIDQLRTKVNKAKNNPLLVSNLLTKDFNIRATSSEAWLTFEQADNKTKFDLDEIRPSYAIGGSDLSSNVDLTAACFLFKIPGDEHLYFKHMYWIPEDLVESKVKEDKVPYDKWIELGYVRTTPGNKVHYKFVADWFDEIKEEYDIYFPWHGYDAWSAEYYVEDMKGRNGKDAMEKVIQGKRTLSGPMQQLSADFDNKLVIYDNNPVTKWCLTNTAVDIDKNGNIQPDKGKNQRRRIDGTAAMLNAYTVLDRRQEEYLNLIS